MKPAVKASTNFVSALHIKNTHKFLCTLMMAFKINHSLSQNGFSKICKLTDTF